MATTPGLPLTLSRKLFLAFSAALAVAVASFALVSYLSVASGFRHYVGANERRELNALAETLGHYYQQASSWDAIRREGPLSAVPPMAPPPQRGAREGQRRPMRYGVSRALSDLPISMPRLMPRLALLDRNGNAVWGPPPGPDWVSEPVTADGTVVGQLFLRPREQLGNELQRQFLAQQKLALLITGGIILLLSGVAAWALSSNLLAPVRNLLSGHKALRRGEYGHRLEVRGKDELSQLLSDFNELAKTLEQTEKIRRQWVADISHELRTPLAILRAELESIQDKVYPLDMQRIHLLHQDVLQLTALVEDLQELALSDIGALTYRKEPLDLRKLLGQICDSFQTRCRKRGLALGTDWNNLDSVPIEGDAGRLSQLFHNLLENSIRYTDKGGRVEVMMRKLSHHWEVTIQDSAPGVPDWALSRLFERLFRVDASRSRRQGGTGLGLTICQNIVQAHGGEIEASHSSLGGLKLTMRWPL